LLANGLCVLLPPRVIIKCAEVLKWNSQFRQDISREL